MPSDNLELDSFSGVDASPGAHELVFALDDMAAIPAVQRLRGTATELLAPRLGHRLLDVGCGTGDVVRTLAGLVGPSGAVVGIDPSEAMLREAIRRTGDRAVPIEFRRGDATALDLDDESFDRARCERVFQHLDSPEAAMAELVRVTKPGGRIVVIDTDWGMHAIHGADSHLTRLVVECWSDNAANGWSGRQLPSLFARAGVREPVVVAETFISTDNQRPTLPPITLMATVAERAGALGADEARAWLSQLAEAGHRGEFFWAATMFAAAGQRS